MLKLLATRRFWPLFATQALGAFNDNLFRSAMLFLIAYHLLADRPGDAAFAATISGGVFILPYFLFSSLSGQLSDRIDKARIARIVKIAEVAIMAVGAAALLWPSLPLLYVVLFAMGTHSTLFGPMKYAILPQHLEADELVLGTGMVEAATFLAILAGQIAGGLLSTPVATAAMLGVALLGLATSVAIPSAPAAEAPVTDWNPVRGTIAILRHAASNPRLFHAIVGISWFFALGAVLTQQFVPLVAGLGATPAVAAFFLATFSVGVALGSLGVVRLMHGRATTAPVWPASLAMALLTAGLSATIRAIPPSPVPVGVMAFLAQPGAPWLTLDLLALAVAGGAYVVPLYATLQTAGDAAARARDVAANNVVNALAMVGVTVVSVAVFAAGSGIAGLFATLAVGGLLASTSARRLKSG